MEKEELTLKSSMLEKMSTNLEKTIQVLTKIAIETHRDSEINLKINISSIKRINKDGKEWIEPEFEYILTNKIKEEKDSRKEKLGFNYSVEIDEEGTVLVENINKQENLFDEEELEDETEDGEEAEPEF